MVLFVELLCYSIYKQTNKLIRWRQKMLKKSIAFICALTLLFSQASIINAVAADKTAPKILSATPKNSQTGVSVTQTISLKFSENIYKGTYFTKIKLTRAGVTVSINRSISKNVIKITHATKLKSGTNYVLTIPAKAVKDSSKNQFTKTVTIKFKTKVETTRTKLSVTEVAKLQSGVVYIELYNKDGNAFASASGFIVDDKVITNCHVLTELRAPKSLCRWFVLCCDGFLQL